MNKRFISFTNYPVKQWLIQLMVLTYVFNQIKLTNLLIIGIGVLWLFDKDLKQRLVSTFKSPYFFPLVSFFLLNVLSLLWATNYQEGLYFLEKRLALILFPLILGGYSLSQQSVKHILYTFVIACFLLTTIGLATACFQYLSSGDISLLYSDNLVSFVGGQGIYLGLYTSLSLFIIVYLFKSQYPFRLPKVMVLFLFLFFIAVTFLSASRNSILALLTFSAGYLVYQVLKEKKYKLALGGFLFMAITFLLLSIVFPSTLKRFKSITNYEFSYDNTNPVNHFNGEVKKENWNGLTLRLAMWSCGWEVFKKNPVIGVSSSDYVDEVMKVYAARNFHYAYERGWGVHNQFLETLICFGLLGAIVFVYGFIYPLYLSIKKGNYLHVVVVLLFLFAFITEGILNRFMGIVLFGFLNSLLAYNPLEEKSL